ncbi:response regulator [Scytonema sp. UIC 10036]|uniref:adenylate/guanylate cyclase domain-containing protein n=1 Tax=Scytonema sp. UIC 10036 TaxID=2304196 RepID=UPI0012DA494E|nr:adenylate/guanylate cyclase domain-containing protein [Scytonema sp. UIC 10036]MUG91078.1 response regulator [Scytonema sp. UIC 10036]
MANNTSSFFTEYAITVLLIDDQPMIGEAVRRMLADEEDIIFHYCSDPAVAIPKAIEVSPKVILQDLVMPDIDGLLLLRFFRANKAIRNVPMIVLSSKEDAKVKAEAFALGANDYLVKLPDKVELIARIRYHAKGYINLLQRNEAYKAIQNYSKKLEKSNELIRQVFGRYLSDEVVASLLESPEGLKLGGERRKITIFTSDLRGFTATAERLSPEEVVKVLNFYLHHMAEVITKHKGTIDEFMGDGILVLFGAPTPREDDATRAIACAVDMQLAMGAVNEQMAEWGLPKLEMGIGINTGEVVVGNIGSDKRTKYGIVGSQVNLTYRIESYTLGGQIFISESTYKEVGQLVKIDGERQVTPKGVKQPITIYEVGGIGGEYNLFLMKEEEVFIPLTEEISIQYTILDGKHINDNFSKGSLVKLSANRALVRTIPGATNGIPLPLSNLKLNFLTPSTLIEGSGDIYAKVLVESAEPGSFYIGFTTMPPSIKAGLDKLYQSLK